ncbi:MAG TPA: hypothetical protein VFJ72_02890, partial [Rubrobacteraceae bacterium]|nr:hypothetical protein [Rubrobacteraceae bacterium]
LAMLRTGMPGRWAGWLALAVALFHVLAALGLAQSGTLAMDGLLANLAPLVFLVWVVATSVPLLRRAGARSGSAGRAPDDAVHPAT